MPPAAWHAALGHDLAGEHKKRDREHRELADATRHLEHDGFERDADPIGARQRRQTQPIGDGYAENEAQKKASDDDQDFHASPVAGWPIRSRSMTKSKVTIPPIGIGR